MRFSRLLSYYTIFCHSSDNASCFHISFSFSAADKAPLCKGGWQKSLISDRGIVLYRYLTIPPSRLSPCHPQAPFVCFADIFPANGEIYPLHKGGFVPTIILQITLLVSVKGRRLYRRKTKNKPTFTSLNTSLKR